VVHHKDQTGQEIQRAILSQVHLKENIFVLDYHLAIDLITENNCCLGAYVLDQKTNKILTFKLLVPSQKMALKFPASENGRLNIYQKYLMLKG
jgi:aspartate oxidase